MTSNPVAGYTPLTNDNSYVFSMQKALASLGYDVKHIKLRDSLRLQGRRDLLFINWIEESAKKNGRFMFSKSLLVVISLIVARLRWKKIIYVKHNNYSHDSGTTDKIISSFLIRFSSLLSDRTIVHSPHLRSSSLHYVPHPLYEISDLEEMPHEASKLIDSEFYFIFGKIKPYKGIEKVIHHWPKNRTLVVAGPTSNGEYLNQIRSIVEERNLDNQVLFIPRRLSEAEVSWLMSRCKASILAHQGPEMIVSGAFFHAVTYGTSVLSTRSDFLRSLVENNIFSDINFIDNWNNLPTYLDKLGESGADIREDALKAFGRENVLAHLELAIGSAPVPKH